MPTSLAAPAVAKIAAPDLRSDFELQTEELVQLLELAADVKRHPSAYANSLAGKAISLLFEKPSLRTRLTFELAIQQLGGHAVTSMGILGEREPLRDIARNLDRWTNGIVARVFSQETIEDLARYSRVPVVNALSDLYHPCQALADVQTVMERFGSVRGLKLAFIGDGNNVAHSLMITAGRLGMDVAVGCPEGYAPNAGILQDAKNLAAEAGAQISVVHNAYDAVKNASVVYTDVWASMGQESEAAERQRIFAPYQVNDALLAAAAPDAIFMHCLPAKRGQEVTDSVMESPQSVIFDQAENRLHAQKALLLMLLQ